MMVVKVKVQRRKRVGRLPEEGRRKLVRWNGKQSGIQWENM